MSQRDTFTRWGVISSGEGGGRIAAQLLAREDNPGIDDRIALLNTNRADILNTIERASLDDTSEFTTVFGSKRGVGNNFIAGEQCAREDLDLIVGDIQERMTGADAFMHMTTLGGGTGNGSIPYLIEQLSGGSDASNLRPWMDSVVHVALAAWPYYDEPAQRQFNAVMGLSRLLMKRNGEQNADMVLLASNSHLNDDGTQGSYDEVNDRIVTAIDLFISAGREARGVIDVEDYVAQPSNIGAYHFTPAVATGLNGRMLEYELLFDRAAEQTFVPMDVTTSRAAYAVVRAPEQLIESGDITETGVQSAFGEWKRDNDIGGAVGMTTLTPKQTRGNDVDVLVLLGGFDLNPLLDHSRDAFETHKQNVEAARQLGNASDDSISEAHVADLSENLERYVSINAR
ncbi:hypothetical protein GRX01_04615 [Halobaculum sp. WSA2]|uniref:Tubulin/FtsZ GTPase domain-containing protein n=1 Tax=Halobaculum saliterrae TaxID=2073113 RepID=A0A6B0SXE9_9EURY|nr:hypothetical protein [Halobaculum saliterrae]MXR40630.1 hypothetical protein [Halobaculum saliterrae]